MATSVGTPRRGVRPKQGSLHRVQADHVALGVDGQHDEAVLSDGHLVAMDGAPGGRDAAALDGAVVAVEVDHRAATRRHASRLHQRSRTSRGIVLHRERPHLDVRARQVLERDLEHRLVEPPCAVHVLHVDFEPSDRIGARHRQPPTQSARTRAAATVRALPI